MRNLLIFKFFFLFSPPMTSEPSQVCVCVCCVTDITSMQIFHLSTCGMCFLTVNTPASLISALPVLVFLPSCVGGFVPRWASSCTAAASVPLAEFARTLFVYCREQQSLFVAGCQSGPDRRDERHLALPIHFTFAPINYSTGQPIKNEGERSGPPPPQGRHQTTLSVNNWCN